MSEVVLGLVDVEISSFEVHSEQWVLFYFPIHQNRIALTIVFSFTIRMKNWNCTERFIS